MLSESIIKLLVELKGANEASQSLRALFEVVTDGVGKVNSGLVHMRNFTSKTGLPNLAADLKDVNDEIARNKKLSKGKAISLPKTAAAGQMGNASQAGAGFKKSATKNILDRLDSDRSLPEIFQDNLAEIQREKLDRENASVDKFLKQDRDIRLNDQKRREKGFKTLLSDVSKQHENDLKAEEKKLDEAAKTREENASRRYAELTKMESEANDKSLRMQESEAQRRENAREKLAADERAKVQERHDKWTNLNEKVNRDREEAAAKKSDQQLLQTRTAPEDRTVAEQEARDREAKRLVKVRKRILAEKKKLTAEEAKERSKKIREDRKAAKEAEASLNRQIKLAEKQAKAENMSASRGRAIAAPRRDAEIRENERLRQSILDVKKAREKGEISVEEETRALKKLNNQLKNNKGARGALIRGLKDGGATLRGFGSQLRNIGQDISFLGRQMVFVGVALAGVFLPAIISAAEFEQKVVNTVAVINGIELNSLKSTVKELSDEFLELGERSEFTAQQIASGAQQLALAGFDTQAIKDSIEAVTSLATVGDLATEDAARIAVNIGKAFKLNAEQFTDVADTLTVVATNSNSTIESLGESFKLLAPIASNLGQDLGEVSVILGSLANAGIRGCFDPETEILTKDGWKFASEIGMGDVFATVNMQSDNLEWHKPKKHFAYHHEGEMFRLSNRYLDMLVTPNHNLVVEQSRKSTNNYSIVPAEEVYKKDLRFKTTIGNQTENVKTFTLPGIRDRNKGFYVDSDLQIDMDDFLRFLGMYLAEGWCGKVDKGNYRVQIAQQQKSKGYQKYLELTERLPFKFNYNDGKFTTHNQQLHQYLRQFGTRSFNKTMPDFLLDLNRRQVRLFLEYYRLGDGCGGGPESDDYFTIYTSSDKLKDGLHTLGTISGYRTTISEKKIKKLPLIKGRVINSAKPQHAVRFNSKTINPSAINSEIKRNQKRQLDSGIVDHEMSKEMVPYSGMVYCVEVPNNTLIVRRNGKSHVSGNSRAGTGTSRLLSELLEKSEEFREKFAEIGSDFELIDPRKVGLTQIIKEFERLQKLGKLDTQDFFELFDERSARVAVTLVNQGADELERLNAILEEDGPGLAERIKDIKLDTLKGDIDILKASFETLSSELGNAVTPALRRLVQDITETVKSITDWIANNKELVAAIVEVTVKTGIAVAAIGSFLLVIGPVISAAGILASGFALLTGAAGLFGATIGTVAGTLGAILLPLLAPFAIALGAIAAVVTVVTVGFIAWTKSIESYNKNFLNPAIKKGLEEIKPVLEEITEASLESAKSLRLVNETLNLFSDLGNLNQLDRAKLFGESTGTSGAKDAITQFRKEEKEFEEAVSAQESKLEQLNKRRDQLRSRFSEGVTKGIFKTTSKGLISPDTPITFLPESRRTKAEVASIDNQVKIIEKKIKEAREDLEKSANAREDLILSFKVGTEGLDTTIEELSNAEDKLNKLAEDRLKVQNNTDLSAEEKEKEIDQIDRNTKLTKTAIKIREDFLNSTSQERVLRTELAESWIKYNDAVEQGENAVTEFEKAKAETAVKNASDAVEVAEDNFNKYAETVDRLNQNAAELNDTLEDFANLSTIAPKTDIEGLAELSSEIENVRKRLFALNEDGSIKLNLKKEFEEGDAIKNQRKAIEELRAEKGVQESNIRLNKKIVANPDSLEAQIAAAEKISKAEANIVETDKAIAKREATILDLKKSQTNFATVSSDAINATKVVLGRQREIEKISEKINAARADGNKILEADLTAQKENLELLAEISDREVALAKSRQANAKKQDPAVKKENDAEEKRINAKKASNETLIKENKKRAIKEFNDIKSLALEESSLQLAQKNKDLDTIEKITKARGKREIDEKVEQLKLSGTEEAKFRKQQEELLQKELDDIRQNPESKSESSGPASRRLSIEDKVASAVLSQAKSLGDQVIAINLINNLEKRRERLAESQSKKALRDAKKLREAKLQASLDPANERKQERVRVLEARSDISRASANSTRNSIGASDLKLNTSVPARETTLADTLNSLIQNFIPSDPKTPSQIRDMKKGKVENNYNIELNFGDVTAEDPESFVEKITELVPPILKDLLKF